MKDFLKIFCRRAFAILLAKPLALLWLGLAVRHRERLPLEGPAIIIANHNSHLDTLVLFSLFPQSKIAHVRAAAAADYFFANKVTRFISKWFLGLVPLNRAKGGREKDPMAPLAEVLENGQILLLFPEGTRGSPEAMGELKPGLWHLARRFPDVPIRPVYLHGLGKSLPKGEWIPVPFFVDVCIGDNLEFLPDKRAFMDEVKTSFAELRGQTLAGLATSEEDF